MDTDAAALIELGGSHDECLYSQVLFLKKYGYNVHLILFEEHLSGMDKWKEVNAWKTWPVPSGFLGEWRLVLGVRKYLRENRIRYAIINTAEGNKIRKLSRLAGGSVNYTGILHLSRKLWTSRSQRIISRKIHKYFVLGSFIRENLDRVGQGIKIDHFYPVYFPGVQTGSPFTGKPETPAGGKQDWVHPDPEAADRKTGAAGPAGKDEFLVCIPGAVDYARRDYRSLMEEMRERGASHDLRFILLGRTSGPDGKEILGMIAELGLKNRFITFEGFLEHRLFYKHLSRADLVLPLITPETSNYSDYLRYKITGTYNLAWGFRIPMLVHHSFRDYRIFRETSEFYRPGELIPAIENLKNSPDKLEELRNNIRRLEDFNFKKQAERYIRFIRQ
jgi:hypothetical protein